MGQTSSIPSCPQETEQPESRPSPSDQLLSEMESAHRAERIARMKASLHKATEDWAKQEATKSEMERAHRAERIARMKASLHKAAEDWAKQKATKAKKEVVVTQEITVKEEPLDD